MRRRWMIASAILAGMLGATWAHYGTIAPVERVVALADVPESMALDERTGRVFIANVPAGSNTVMATVSVLDAATGSLLRTVQTPLRAVGEGCCRLLAVADEPAGRVYVSSSGADRLLALDARNGDVRAVIPNTWVSDLLPPDSAGRMPVVAADRSFSGVRVLDGHSGAVLSSFPCADALSAPYLGPGVVRYRPLSRLFVRSSSMRDGVGVCIIDPPRGRTLPRVRIGPNTIGIDALALDEHAARVFVATHHMMSGDPDLGAGTVTVLDARTGRVLRSTAVGPFPSQMIVASGRLFVLNSDDYQGPGSVSILDAATGRLLRTTALGATAASLALDSIHGQLLVRHLDGGIDRLDVRTGQLLPHRTPEGIAVTLGADPGTQRTFTIPLSDPIEATATLPATGIVQVRDTHTWAVLRTLTVPGAIGAMVIDTRRHRGFLTLANCRARVADPLAWLPDWVRRLPFLARAKRVPAFAGCVLVLDTRR